MRRHTEQHEHEKTDVDEHEAKIVAIASHKWNREESKRKKNVAHKDVRFK